MGKPDHGLDLNRPYAEQDPLDMDDAREAARRAAQLRRDAEAEYRRRIDVAAEAEATYRKLRSKAILAFKGDHGATVARDLADGDDKVAEALVEHLVSKGMVDAMKERLKTLEGERSMLKSLIDWSSSIANVLRQTSGRGS